MAASVSQCLLRRGWVSSVTRSQVAHEHWSSDRYDSCGSGDGGCCKVIRARSLSGASHHVRRLRKPPSFSPLLLPCRRQGRLPVEAVLRSPDRYGESRYRALCTSCLGRMRLGIPQGTADRFDEKKAKTKRWRKVGYGGGVAVEATADGGEYPPSPSPSSSSSTAGVSTAEISTECDPVEEIVDDVVVYVWRELDRRYNLSEKFGWKAGSWRKARDARAVNGKGLREENEAEEATGEQEQDEEEEAEREEEQEEEKPLRILFQVRKMAATRVRAGQDLNASLIEAKPKRVQKEYDLDLDQLVADALSVAEAARSETGALLRATQKGIEEMPSTAARRLAGSMSSLSDMVGRYKDVRRWDAKQWFVIGLCLTSLVGGMWWATATSRRRAIPSLPSASESAMDAGIPYPTAENAAAMIKKALASRGKRVGGKGEGFDGDWVLTKHVKVGNRRVRVERGVEEGGGSFEKAYVELQRLGGETEGEEVDGRHDSVQGRSEWSRSLLLKTGEGRGGGGGGGGGEAVVESMGWRERLEGWEKVVRADNRENGGDPDGVFVVARSNSPRSSGSYVEHLRRTWWRNRPAMAYSDLLRQIQEGEVRRAAYSQDFSQLYVEMKDGFPAEFKVDIPTDPYLRDLMEICDVEVSETPVSLLTSGLQVAALVLPTVLVVKALAPKKSRKELALEEAEEMREVTKRAWAAAESRTNTFLWRVNMPQNLPKRDERIKEALRNGVGLELFETPARGEGLLEDVVGMPKVKTIIRDYLKMFSDPGFYQQYGLIIPKGILLHGPPGCGKTLFARAMAVECGLPFIAVGGSELMELISNHGHCVIRNLFAAARYLAPCVVFIDEIDALASKSVEEDEERSHILEMLYLELDSLAGPHDIMDVDQAFVVVGATNRVEELAQDFVRLGRMDRLVYVGRPTWRDRIEIFDVHKRGHRMDPDVDFSKIVYRTAGMSGADIKNLINEAGLIAVRESRDHIIQQDFVDVLDRMLFESVAINLTKEELEERLKLVPKDNERLLAVHEAGHVVLSMLYPNYDLLTFVILYPGGQERAMSVYYPRNERFDIPGTTVGYVQMHMVVAFGGICAERLFFGEKNLTDGGSEDLMKISNLARELIVAGVSNKLGLFQIMDRETARKPFPYDQVPLLPSEWQDRSNQKPVLPPELGELFTREVSLWVEWAEDEAMEAIRENKDIVEAVADALIKQRKLTGEEVKDLVDSMNPRRFPDLMEYPSFEEVISQPLVVDPNNAGPYEPLDVHAAPLHRC